MTKRGRPRQFDQEIAAQQMMELFWRKGFTATSLDDIAEATHVNRPSLYSAFGSKQDMYVMCLNRFSDSMSELAKATLNEADTFEEALKAFFAGILDVYFDEPQRDLRLGCFVFSGAVAEATENEVIKDAVGQALNNVQAELTTVVAKHFPEASSSSVGMAIDTAVSAFLSLGTRVRSGSDRRTVEKTVHNSIQVTLSTLEPV